MTMQRVVVDHYGGPEVLRVAEEEEPHPGPGEVCVRVLAAGVSFTDQLIRAGTYLGGPKPPFTPGYELVGVVEELGEGESDLRPGDRVAALTVWGGYAERVCIPQATAIPVPGDLDPAEVVSLVFPYMTAYQLLHRMTKAKRGETVLVHGAAGRVGTAVLELGALLELRIYGTASGTGCALVEGRGGVAIDYEHEDFLRRVRALTGEGVDIALDGLGGWLSVRSFSALRPGGRLVIFGHHSTLAGGRRSWRGWAAWYASTACAGAAGLLSARRHVLAYRIAKLRDRHPGWFREDLHRMVELLRQGELRPNVVERLPLAEARRAHELLAGSASKGRIVLVPELGR
jgi:NADPH:quinone reductase-like Zn-dependent oxidoreductase